jgi:hypothetical protein
MTNPPVSRNSISYSGLIASEKYRIWEILFSHGRTIMAGKPKPPPSWEDRARRFLKAELARAEIGYRELAERLAKHGLRETEASIANKISRGSFPATFLLASLIAIGREQVSLQDI